MLITTDQEQVKRHGDQFLPFLQLRLQYHKLIHEVMPIFHSLNSGEPRLRRSAGLAKVYEQV